MIRSFALVAVLLSVGCVSAPPTGRPLAPEVYPDRTTVDEAWNTFLWAWTQGDVGVLLQVTGWRMRAKIRKQVETNGEEAVAVYYRDGAEDMRIVDAEWTTRGQEMAYLRAVISSSTVPRVEVEFSFVERPDGWILTQQRTLR